MMTEIDAQALTCGLREAEETGAQARRVQAGRGCTGGD
jgi:hypothetical protein